MIPAVMYQPHGCGGRKRTEFEVVNIHEADAEYIREHNILVSMEETILGIVVYFDYGALEDDGETPRELLLMSKDYEDCFALMADAVKIIQERKDGK